MDDDWKNGVDKKLVDLTSAQRSTDDELDELEIRCDTLDRIILGDPEKDISGYQERLHNVENGLQDIRAQHLKEKMSDDTTRGIRWQSITTIIVAIIGTLAWVLPNLDKIAAVFHEKEPRYEPDDKLRREIERDKRRHHKKKAVVVQAELQQNTTGQ